MKLFRINDKSLKFDLVGLSKKTFAKMKKIILKNGGEIEHNAKQPVKFTEDSQYVTYAFPAYMLYSIQFIYDCIKNGTIVNPSSYRIGTPLLCDNLVMHHFLHGECNHCATESTNILVKMERQDSTDNEEHFSEAENDENDANVLKLKTSQRILSHSQEANVLRQDYSENSDDNNEEPDDGGDGLNSQCNSTPLLQPKKNVSLAETNNVTTSEADHLSSHVVAGVSSRKRHLGHFEFVADSNEEENIIPEDHQNQTDKNPLETSSMPDDTDETPKKQAKYFQNQTIPQVKTETVKKRGRGPTITPLEDIAIVKFLTENRLISQVESGLRVWEELLNSGICRNRTANSLYKHFYRSILPRIRTFKLTETELKRFEKISKKNIG